MRISLSFQAGDGIADSSIIEKRSEKCTADYQIFASVNSCTPLTMVLLCVLCIYRKVPVIRKHEEYKPTSLCSLEPNPGMCRLGGGVGAPNATNQLVRRLPLNSRCLGTSPATSNILRHIFTQTIKTKPMKKCSPFLNVLLTLFSPLHRDSCLSFYFLGASAEGLICVPDFM